jgi:uncharacterized protein YegJ (DUF2314 family)
MTFTRCLLAAACVFAFASCKDKAKEERKVALRDFMHGNTGDAELATAMEKARSTVGEFLAALQKPAQGQSGFIVRKSFPTKIAGKQQILLVNFVTYDGTLLHGKVDDNTSQPGSGVPPDGAVAFPPNEIADWMFNENGKTVGGYMLRVFKAKFPEDWEKARYGEKIQFKE